MPAGAVLGSGRLGKGDVSAMTERSRRWLTVWAVAALVWVLAVVLLFPGNISQDSSASQDETSRSEAGLAEPEPDGMRKAYLAIMPPAGTLVTGILLSWFVSRPRRGREKG
jgi:hypothetical protein